MAGKNLGAFDAAGARLVLLGDADVTDFDQMTTRWEQFAEFLIVLADGMVKQHRARMAENSGGKAN